MEASAGQVIQDEVRVRSVCVRVAAALVLVGQLQMSRWRGALGRLAVAAAVGGKPCFTEVAAPQEN